MTPGLLLAVLGCVPEPTTPTGTAVTEPTDTLTPFPLPDDVDTIPWEDVFADAVGVLRTVTAQSAWEGHVKSMDFRQPGCPDFWSGLIDDGGVMVGNADGVSWYDACSTDAGVNFDGWAAWESEVTAEGDATTDDGRTTQASRTLWGDGLVSDDDGLRFELKADNIDDNLYTVFADGYNRFTYSTSVDATVTGRDVFAADSATPEGYRTDLYQFISGGDVDGYEARGDVYLFTPQLRDRFDSIAIDVAIQGPLGAGPDDCLLEPLGWIGVRDENAIWYDVVFLPRYEDDIVEKYPNDPLSVCDGLGRLYIQGIEQEGRNVAVDFSFLFDGSVELPTAEDYILPWHSL